MEQCSNSLTAKRLHLRPKGRSFSRCWDKNDPKDIFINSLKGIQTLQPNGNNLPFQCKWDNNREIVQRSFMESKNFILSALAESVKLRANIYLAFKEFFGDFFVSIRC